jgi:hypothetical protein
MNNLRKGRDYTSSRAARCKKPLCAVQASALLGALEFLVEWEWNQEKSPKKKKYSFPSVNPNIPTTKVVHYNYGQCAQQKKSLILLAKVAQKASSMNMLSWGKMKRD